MTPDPSRALVHEILDELSALVSDLGPGETEDYVRTSLARLVTAVVEHGEVGNATDRLSRSLQLLDRQRARGLRRTERDGRAGLARMQALVDDCLRPAFGPELGTKPAGSDGPSE